MTTKKATRRQLQLRRANLSRVTDVTILAQFERASWHAAWIMGIAFGLCFFFGII